MNRHKIKTNLDITIKVVNIMSELSYTEGLEKALEHEALAIFKYSFYLNQLKNDQTISPEQRASLTAVFKRLIENETEHAEAWMKELTHHDYQNTIKNLEELITTELQESSLYLNNLVESAQQDRQGITELMYRSTSLIERSHAADLVIELGKITATTPALVQVKVWRCSKCGNILWNPKMKNDSPPDRNALVSLCWVCGHDRADAELVDIWFPRDFF